MIKIQAKFTDAQIKRYLHERVQAMQEAIFRRLQRVGTQFVRNARENGTYNDITGNLRSSIGYIIMKDGITLDENFERVKQKYSPEIKNKPKSNYGKYKGREGVEAAKTAIKAIADGHPHGFVLIVVAGAEYAASVEAKGKDVLTASSITAREDLKRAMISIQKKLDA